MSAGHMPGPWQVHHEPDCTGYPHYVIHGLSGEQKHHQPTLDANARLIAAAPDLLAALKDAEEHLEEMRKDEKFHPIGHCPVLDNVRAVIAKAEGKQPREKGDTK